MASRSRPNPHRAGAQYAWTEPLRARRRRHQQLAAASVRLAVIALGAAVPLAVWGASRLSGRGLGLLLVLLAVLGAGGLLLARAAGAEVRRLDEEMDGIEEEARRHLG